MIKLSIKGKDIVDKRLKKSTREKGRLLEKGMKEAAEHLLRKSLEVCPKDTGRLRKSGKVKRRGQGKNAAFEVVYEAPYAIYVHEMPNKGINWTTPGTGNKYLERPARQERSTMRRIVRETLTKK
jgi:hypothetical protein